MPGVLALHGSPICIIPLFPASIRNRIHLHVCQAKGGDKNECNEPVNPDLIIPPPSMGSQYQPSSEGTGGGKGGWFHNPISGGGFGEGGGGGRKKQKAARFAPFNQTRLMLLSIGWAASIYLVLSSVFKLLRAAAVRLDLTSWLGTAHSRRQLQFKDDGRTAEEASDQDSNDEYEAVQAGGAGSSMASACMATGVSTHSQQHDSRSTRDSKAHAGSSSRGESCSHSQQSSRAVASGLTEDSGRTLGEEASGPDDKSSPKSGGVVPPEEHGKRSGADNINTKKQRGSSQNGQSGNINGAVSSSASRMSEEQRVHMEMLRKYDQRRQAKVAASVSVVCV